MSDHEPAPDDPACDRTQTEFPRAGPDPLADPETPSEHGEGDLNDASQAGFPGLQQYAPARYSAVSEHARGGLGRIVEARDEHLCRTVAIKELLESSRLAEALFVREALITARLQHPGIVPVHEAGRWASGEPYYVMKMVAGRTLRELIADRETFVSRLALLPNVIAVAETLAYAHSEGVIHRDIKPANVMVGDYGETIVVDWGLARDRAHGVPGGDAETSFADLDRAIESHYTVSGKVVGTPAYMAPEQARGDEVTERCDVYALGALLYEVLAGAPPYPGGNPHSIIERVLAGPPEPLEERQQGVPPDLAAIARKAMARDPDRRYPDAGALADDLRRFQTGQLVSAHSYSTAALVRRWLRAHRVAVAAAAAGLAVLIVVGTLAVIRVWAERDVARAAQHTAEQREQRLLVSHARSALAGDPTLALAWLADDRIDYDQLDDATRARAIDIAARAVADGVARDVLHHPGKPRMVAFADERTLIVGLFEGRLYRWDLETRTSCLIGATDGEAFLFASVPGRPLVAAGAMNGAVHVWDLATGRARVFDGGDDALGELVFSRDGTRLLAVGRRGGQVWRMPSGERLVSACCESGRMVVLAEDSGHVAVGSPDGVVRIYPPEATGVDARQTRGPAIALPTRAGPDARELGLGFELSALGISPDARHLLAVAVDQAIYRVDVASSERVLITERMPPLFAYQTSRDGRRIALGFADGGIDVVRFEDGAVVSLREHEATIRGVAFAPGDEQLVSASSDQTARVWNLATGTTRALRGHADDLSDAAVSPDGASIATASLDGTVRVWTLDEPGRVVLGSAGLVRSVVALGARGIATSDVHGEIRVWSVASGAGAGSHRGASRVLRAAPGRDTITVRLAASADGRFVATGAPDTIDVWDLDRDTRRAFPAWRRTLRAFAVSPTGGTLAIASDGLGTALLDVASGERVAMTEAVARRVVFSPDGSRLVARTDEALELWDVATRRRLDATPTPPWRRILVSLQPAFSPDGSAVAFVNAQGVWLWDLRAGEVRVRALATGPEQAGALAFSPDGASVAVGFADGSVRSFPVAGGDARAFAGHTEIVHGVAYAAGGRVLVSAGRDQTVRVWDVDTGRSRVLYGHTAPVVGVVGSPDSEWIYTVSQQGAVRAWHLGADSWRASPAIRDEVRAELRAELRQATTARVGRDDRPFTAAASARPCPVSTRE